MTLRSFLYALLWLSFAQIALGLPPLSTTTYIVDTHAGVGIAVLALAHMNFAKLRRSGAPVRLKRIARATAILATVQVVLGIVLFLVRLGVDLDATATAAISFVHLVIALGILAEAASVATAHDIWEKREYAAPAP